MICVSYTRSRIRFGEALSITEQNEKINAWMKGRRMTIDQKYSDRKEDINADEGFNEMKEAGINRQFECVVFWSIMYFGNDPLVGYNLLLHTFIPAGIDFAVVCDNFFSVGHSVDEIEEYLENKYKERRNAHGKAMARIAASSRRNTLYGYEKHGDEFVMDKMVEPIVREIFQLNSQGKTMNEICRHLNDKGVECPQIYLRRVAGADISNATPLWEHGQIKKILTDERYMGINRTTRNGVDKVGKIDPYITKEEYEKNIAKFKKRGHVTKRENLFQKMIFDNDSHERLYMGDYMSDGGFCYYLSKKTEEYEHYKKKVIDVQTVIDEVVRQMNLEIELAKHIARCIASESGKAELSSRRGKILERLQNQMEQLLCRVDTLVAPDMDFSLDDEMSVLDDALSQSVAHKNEDEITLSDLNPWVKLYGGLDEVKELSSDFCKEYIGEVLIDRFEKVILVPKHNEWKQKLPSYWLEV